MWRRPTAVALFFHATRTRQDGADLHYGKTRWRRAWTRRRGNQAI